MTVQGNASRIVAEAVGTGLLLAVVVGSGIMADRLAGGSAEGSAGLALLCNAIATGAGLLALIWTFGPVSGAHFNPVVTLVEAMEGKITAGLAAGYVAAQIAGAIGGVGLADAMFGLAPWSLSQHERSGAALWLSEVVATFGLIAAILSTSRRAPATTPIAVAGWIVAAYWCTPSTSFANPAATLARSLTDTFTGIRPEDVLGFVSAQVVGAALGAVFCRWIVPPAGGST